MKRLLAIAILAVGCSPARADRSSDDSPPGAVRGAAPDAGSPASFARALLQRDCAPCHRPPEPSGGMDIVDIPRLIEDRYILPGDAAGSPIVQRIAAGEMPPAPAGSAPSPAELAAIRAWIDAMPAPAAAPSPIDQARALAADAAALPRDARPHARWFTLAHLASAGASEPQLARYRTALAVMLASLSWAPVARPPVAIDAARTMFRIDLRDLGWSAATWDAIRGAYPYGAAPPPGAPEAIRADWFVATASRPPLYHAILELPETDVALARRLGVDLAEDLAAGRVARAGFTSSGVSVHNRVIERHATRHGALWRSYDFNASLGRADVFAHPLDFVPAGGELIFNLPNGLQGYMLVDGAGKRIDKAPTAIVSDPRRPDRAVETAVSCFGCHAAGIIERADQLRDAVRDQPFAVRDRVAALHPPADQLARLYATDRARFAGGLRALGAAPVPPNEEPVTLLVARYEAELDLRLAAAELGLSGDDLERRLARSPALRRALAGLTAPGGAIKRDAWEAVFPRALAELGAGVPLSAAAARDPSPAAGTAVWLDRRQRSWVRVGRARDPGLDQAAAIAACRARGLELPRTDELDAAIADGLAAGLALDAPLWTAGTKLDAANQRYAAIVDPFTGAARRADAADRHGAVCVQL